MRHGGCASGRHTVACPLDACTTAELLLPALQHVHREARQLRRERDRIDDQIERFEWALQRQQQQQQQEGECSEGGQEGHRQADPGVSGRVYLGGNRRNPVGVTGPWRVGGGCGA